MTVALTQLRSTIAEALSNPTVWQVSAFPQASPLAFSVQISPDDPYVEPSNNQQASIAPMANFKLTMIVPMFDNQSNLADIENYMVQLFNKLATSTLNFRVGTMSAPSVMGVDAGQMLSCDLSVSILTTWS
jgi:hypothetical protein